MELSDQRLLWVTRKHLALYRLQQTQEIQVQVQPRVRPGHVLAAGGRLDWEVERQRGLIQYHI